MQKLSSLQSQIDKLKRNTNPLETRPLVSLINNVRDCATDQRATKALMKEVATLRTQSHRISKDKRDEAEMKEIAVVLQNAQALEAKSKENTVALKQIERVTLQLLSEVRNAL